MNARLALLLLANLCACGDSKVDLSGMYLVTYHTQNESDCSVEGASVDEPAYFLMAEEDIFGQTYYSLGECESQDESTCSGGGLFLGMIFSKPIDNGWAGEMSMSSGSGDPCALTYSEAEAVFQDDDSLRVEVRAWGEETTVGEGECGYELAEERGTDMPCTNFEVMIGEASSAAADLNLP